MPSTAEIIDHVQTLSEAERVSIGVQILETTQHDDQLGDVQKKHVEEVLLNRVDGPFVPYDSGMADRIKARGRERLKKRQQDAQA